MYSSLMSIFDKNPHNDNEGRFRRGHNGPPRNHWLITTFGVFVLIILGRVSMSILEWLDSANVLLDNEGKSTFPDPDASASNDN